MLQAGTTISNNHLVDHWREEEVAAVSRLEAWDDLTGLSLDPKGVLSARRQELDYIAEKGMGGSTKGGSEAQWVEDHQVKMDRHQQRRRHCGPLSQQISGVGICGQEDRRTFCGNTAVGSAAVLSTRGSNSRRRGGGAGESHHGE